MMIRNRGRGFEFTCVTIVFLNFSDTFEFVDNNVNMHAPCTLIENLCILCGSAGSDKGRVPGATSVKRSSKNFRSSCFGVHLPLTQKFRHSTRKSSAVGGSARAEIYIDNEIYVEEAEAKAVPTTQKGWTYSEYGAKEVLKFEDIPVPEVKPDEVLVKVQAAALNPVDSKRRLGKFKATDSELPVGSILLQNS